MTINEEEEEEEEVEKKKNTVGQIRIIIIVCWYINIVGWRGGETAAWEDAGIPTDVFLRVPYRVARSGGGGGD